MGYNDVEDELNSGDWAKKRKSITQQMLEDKSPVQTSSKATSENANAIEDPFQQQKMAPDGELATTSQPNYSSLVGSVAPAAITAATAPAATTAVAGGTTAAATPFMFTPAGAAVGIGATIAMNYLQQRAAEAQQARAQKARNEETGSLTQTNALSNMTNAWGKALSRG